MITALTAQNTQGVTAIHDVPADFIAAQIDAVFSDLDVARGEDRHAVARRRDRSGGAGLARHRAKNIVLDPVMVATSGDRAAGAPTPSTRLRRELIPRALVVTPNLPEAAALTGAIARAQRAAKWKRRRARSCRSARAAC